MTARYFCIRTRRCCTNARESFQRTDHHRTVVGRSACSEGKMLNFFCSTELLVSAERGNQRAVAQDCRQETFIVQGASGVARKSLGSKEMFFAQ